MLSSHELPIVEQVFGHGFLTKDGQDMRKSVNKTLDLEELIERHGTNAIRYDFLKGIQLRQDKTLAKSVLLIA